jgi:hypothetical protein
LESLNSRRIAYSKGKTVANPNIAKLIRGFAGMKTVFIAPTTVFVAMTTVFMVDTLGTSRQ